MKKLLIIFMLITIASTINALDYSDAEYDNQFNQTNMQPEQSVYTNSYYGTPSLGIGGNQPLQNNQQIPSADPYATPEYPYTDADIIE
ncbi:MAG: hypothetical protein ACOYT8_01445 [Candidatus Dependentiae bacterium]